MEPGAAGLLINNPDASLNSSRVCTCVSRTPQTALGVSPTRLAVGIVQGRSGYCYMVQDQAWTPREGPAQLMGSSESRGYNALDVDA